MDRMMPQATDAEKAVLGAVILDNCIDDVQSVLSGAKMFYSSKHQKIYKSMIGMAEREEKIDLITLSDELKRQRILDEVGGTYYLTELGETILSSASVVQYAKIVKEKYLLREIIKGTMGLTAKAYQGESISDIIDEIGRLAILDVRDDRESTFKESMHKWISEIDESKSRGMSRVRSSIVSLNEKTYGFQNSDLIVIAGRPSHGKTAFMIDIICETAIHQKVPVGIVELEMKTSQLVNRIVAMEARVNSFQLQFGQLDKDQFSQVSGLLGKLETAPIHIDDTPGMNVSHIKTQARRWKQKYQIGLICVDYLQIMSPGEGDNRNHQLGNITRQLKWLAKELNIPVVLLSQLSRKCEAEKRRPRLDDLRDSGEIENDADLILFVYRPELFGIKKDKKGNSNEGMAELVLAKQRNGPTGSFKVKFLTKWAGFEEMKISE